MADTVRQAGETQARPDNRFPIEAVAESLRPYIHSCAQTKRIRAALTAALASKLVVERDGDGGGVVTSTGLSGISSDGAAFSPPSGPGSSAGAAPALTHSMLASPAGTLGLEASTVVTEEGPLWRTGTRRGRYLEAIARQARARRRAAAVRAEIRDLVAGWERDRRFGLDLHPVAAPVEMPVEAATREYVELLSRRKQARQWDSLAAAIGQLDDAAEQDQVRAGLHAWLDRHEVGDDEGRAQVRKTMADIMARQGAGEQGRDWEESVDGTVGPDEWRFRVRADLLRARAEFSQAVAERAAATDASAAAAKRNVRRQIYALDRARQYLTSWLDVELSVMAESDADANEKKETDGDEAEQDRSSAKLDEAIQQGLGLVRQKYSDYVAARISLVDAATTTADANGDGLGQSTATSVDGDFPGETTLAEVVVPALPALLRYSRCDRQLQQLAARVRRQTAAARTATEATTERLLDSSFLLRADGDFKPGRIDGLSDRPEIEAGRLATIQTRIREGHGATVSQLAEAIGRLEMADRSGGSEFGYWAGASRRLRAADDGRVVDVSGRGWRALDGAVGRLVDVDGHTAGWSSWAGNRAE